MAISAALTAMTVLLMEVVSPDREISARLWTRETFGIFVGWSVIAGVLLTRYWPRWFRLN